MSLQKLQAATGELLRATAVGVVFGLVLMVAYLAFEPVLGKSASDEFIITQSITGEISFNASTTDVSMQPAIASVTGGTSTGATQVVINSNSITGYTMDIRFSSSTALNQNNGTSSIANYTATSTPDFDFTVALNSAGFGYTVEASSTDDVDPTFKDNGVSCNTGTNNTANSCWLSPSTTDERIITRNNLAPSSGATSTVKFQLVVNANPNPAIPSGTYTATATLTALNK